MGTTTDSQNLAPTSHFRLPNVLTFFNRKWWWTTLLVLIGIAVLARLGIWQLDRLEQRRAHNAEVGTQLAQPPLDLVRVTLPDDLTVLRGRQATVRGEYDLSRQIALTQQNWNNSPGFHLIAPLVIEGTGEAVLVDRGWLPTAQLNADNWTAYDVEGPVSVMGYIQLSQGLDNAASGGGTEAKPRWEWYRLDIDAIGEQMPYALSPVYLQQVPPAEGNTSLPFRARLDADLSEGNHLSYAIQWFIFAAILAAGYVYFVGKRTEEPSAMDGELE
jgi:surfeit locus 1 family protein